ncbi:hypothetical protein [Sedimenticola selenatireducens]|uniref:hypothetical protein n=1 Tax=Sedimenticola selenatireducens TaxID=191960 RepID=UPI002AABD8F0|nr:hypothetical protein [Sedimenticola selenatireducens]
MNADIAEADSKQLKGKIEEEIHSRRLVLRGVLAVGCSLVFPVALIGCDSKEGEKSSSAAPAGSSPSGTNTESAAPATEVVKAPQQVVQYQTEPRNGQKCDGCLHFIAGSNSCKLVEGQISPDGWCTLWTKKS